MRREEEANRRAERARLAEQESKRREKLTELADDWKRAQEIRNFVAAIKSRPFENEVTVAGRTLSEWLDWAEATANALDRSGDGAQVFTIVGGAGAAPHFPWMNR